MVSIGTVVEKVANQSVADKTQGKDTPAASEPKGQVLDPDFVAKKLEQYGFNKSVAGEPEFKRAVKAVCHAAVKNRGLLLTGGNGCGKTRLLEAVWKLMKCSQKTWVSCADEAKVNGLVGDPELYDRHIFLDDYGAEVFKYGDVDRIGNFICCWHDCERRKRERHGEEPFKRFLYVATNLTGKQIDERSGGRVYDRLRGDCVILQMRGGSKRGEIIIQ